MIDKVYNILKPLNIETNYLIRPRRIPGISYHFFNDRAIFFGDGEIKRESVSVQIDIWDKRLDYKHEELKEKIKYNMVKNGFLYSRQDTNYESKVNLYHTFIVFNYYKGGRE